MFYSFRDYYELFEIFEGFKKFIELAEAKVSIGKMQEGNYCLIK